MGAVAPPAAPDVDAERLQEAQARQLERALLVATELAQAGQLTARGYNAQVLKIAWTYVLIQRPIRALALLHCVPDAYFGGPFEEDAVADRELAEVGRKFSMWLVDRGFVDEGVGVAPAITGHETGRA